MKLSDYGFLIFGEGLKVSHRNIEWSCLISQHVPIGWNSFKRLDATMQRGSRFIEEMNMYNLVKNDMNGITVLFYFMDSMLMQVTSSLSDWRSLHFTEL